MAIAIVQDVPGANLEFYQAVNAELDFVRNPIAGLKLHVAGMAANGLRVIEVWESQVALDAFRRDRLGPAVAKVAGQPMTMPPAESFEVAQIFGKID